MVTVKKSPTYKYLLLDTGEQALQVLPTIPADAQTHWPVLTSQES